MRIQDDPVRVGEVASKSINSGEPVSDGNVEAFADTSDFPEHVVGLDVAALQVSHVDRNDQQMGETRTYNEVMASIPITL